MFSFSELETEMEDKPIKLYFKGPGRAALEKAATEKGTTLSKEVRSRVIRTLLEDGLVTRDELKRDWDD